MKKILVLDNYDSFTYNLVHHLHAAGYGDGKSSSIDVIRNDKITLDQIAAYDKILLSPGPGIPSEAGIMQELIKRYSESKSILGICLGHQGIAEVFGGHLLNMKTVVHGKASKVKLVSKNEPLFAGLPQTIEAGRYHSWIVSRDELPECLEITAETENGEIMALSHKHLDVKGVQFHPESVLTPHGKEILVNWMEH